MTATDRAETQRTHETGDDEHGRDEHGGDGGRSAGERGRWTAFAVAVAVAALTILDLSKVNVGLPSIESSLKAQSSQLQLIVAGYALAFGLALVPAGRLGDIRSRKTMFLVGLSLFIVTSVACALAPNIEILTIARLAQGIAAGIQMPQVLGLVQQLFQGAERGRALGIFGATVGAATAFGPTLGGLLIAVGGAQDGWRLLFWMNVPLGVILLVFAARVLTRPKTPPAKDAHLDLIGVSLLGVAILGLMLPFLLTTGQGDDPRRFLFLIAFAVFGAAFIWWEHRYRKRGKSPAVRLELFGRASYRNGLIVQTVYFAAVPSLFLVSTLFLQQGLQLEPVFAGLTTAPFALTSAFASLIGGRLVNRFGRLLVVIGLVGVIVGIVLLMLAATIPPASASPYWMAAAYLVAGAGGGIVVSPNQTLTLSEVPPKVGGVAGSMNQLGQRVGTAIGTAIVTAIFFGIITAEAGSSMGRAAIGAYHDAYRLAALLVIGLVLAALAIALVDQVQRMRRDGTATPTQGDDHADGDGADETKGAGDGGAADHGAGDGADDRTGPREDAPHPRHRAEPDASDGAAEPVGASAAQRE